MPTTDNGSGSALAALRRHWLVAALAVLLLTLAGVAVGLTRPITYTGETRLAVGKGEMSALNIPGYPTAAKEMASNYSRWVTDQGVSGIKPPAGTISLSASPIPESSVIRIEATSTDPDTAVKASQTAADALVAEVAKARAENDPAEIMKDIVAHAPDLSKAQAGAGGNLAQYNRDLGNKASADVLAADLEAYAKADTARAQLQAEQDARLDRYRRVVSQSSTEADLVPIGQGAQIVSNDRNSTVQRTAMLGFGAGVLLALLVAALLDRRRRASTRAAEAAQAAGAAQAVQAVRATQATHRVDVAGAREGDVRRS